MISTAFERLKQAGSHLPGVRLRARMLVAKPTRKTFAAVAAIAGSLMISSTAPALLEGASFRAIDGGDKAGGAPLSRPIDETVSAAGDSGSASLTLEQICSRPDAFIEYRGANAVSRSVELNDDVIPSTVRSKIADNQLFTNLPDVAATVDDNDDSARGSPTNASSRADMSKLAKLSAALIQRTRVRVTFRPAGCSRCGEQVAQLSASRGKSFVLMSFLNIARNARPVRREHLPSGVARQREVPRVTAWVLRRG